MANTASDRFKGGWDNIADEEAKQLDGTKNMDGFYDQKVPLNKPHGKTSGEKPVNDRKQKHIQSNLPFGTEDLFQDLYQLPETWLCSVSFKVSPVLKMYCFRYPFCCFG
ncbi:hypothetical protein AALO_G00186050 [Alosa alosa]|uniref:PEA3-type ETS-domain transcription factor N-terminal domain-containing protein n=1 Tax=Alosa alosa TaxID=278164 RepID=A0AAV6GDK9_9TELE|nr:hypothetical protein AALO_G00186050 [Alosa alosa]